jgi:anti-anti-sigma factor
MITMTHRTRTTDAHRTSAGDRAVRLVVAGELDLTTAERLSLDGQRALTGCTRTTLTIDMSQVTFIDAAAIGALVTMRQHAALDGNAVVVTEPSRCVVRLLELTALAGSFGVGSPIEGADWPVQTV